MYCWKATTPAASYLSRCIRALWPQVKSSQLTPKWPASRQGPGNNRVKRTGQPGSRSHVGGPSGPSSSFALWGGFAPRAHRPNCGEHETFMVFNSKNSKRFQGFQIQQKKVNTSEGSKSNNSQQFQFFISEHGQHYHGFQMRK